MPNLFVCFSQKSLLGGRNVLETTTDLPIINLLVNILNSIRSQPIVGKLVMI